MFRNHLKLVLRKLRKEKLYSIVNILGLTIGLTAFLLIALYIRDELSFDKFHYDADQIYLMTSYDEVRDSRGTQIPVDFVEYVERGVSEVEAFTRIKDESWKSMDLIQSNASDFYAEKMFHADANFFDFFDFELMDGSANDVLSELGSVVLTESFAMKLFNRLDVIGEELIVNKEETYLVSGVCKDAPRNSSIQFELIARASDNVFKDKFSQGRMENATSFVKLSNNEALEAVLAPVNNEIRMIPGYFKVSENVKYELHKLQDIRMKAGLSSTDFQTTDAQAVFVFSVIALVILFLAIINYVNLVTAQSIRKVKEIGLRKVIGAGKVHLLKYQLLESTIISMVSLVLSFGITERLLPILNGYLSKGISLNYFSSDFFLWVIVFGLFLGLVSGLYPAYYIARIRPLSLMSKSIESGGGRGLFRKSLVLFQFTASGIIILVLLVMSRQMSYLNERSMGFDKENLIALPIYDDNLEASNELKNEILQVSGVNAASFNTWAFGRMISTDTYDRRYEKGGSEPLITRTDMVMADKDRISQVVCNLLSNAVKFSKPKDEVTIRAFRSGNLVKVEIEDHGVGIAESEHESIFTRFHQISPGESGPTKSSGLGLSISKELIEMHGGEIAFSSSLGNGATFSFSLKSEDQTT